MTLDLLIGEIAKQFGLSTQAIRYYEKIGLIESRRSAKGYRLYSFATVERLRLIQYAQKFGFTLDRIKELLAVEDLQACANTLNEMVEDRLKELEQQLKQIETATAELSQRQQQLSQLIAEDNTSILDTSAEALPNLRDRHLLDLFQKIEKSLSIEDRTASKAQKLLEQYSTGERNFQGIELIGAELNGAFLNVADFSHAEMMLASLNEVAMERTKLNRAYLSGADFIDAYLHQAELIEANLVGADLTGANLTEAVLIGANLTGANLKDAVILGCNFQEANLSGAICDRN